MRNGKTIKYTHELTAWQIGSLFAYFKAAVCGQPNIEIVSLSFTEDMSIRISYKKNGKNKKDITPTNANL